MIRFQWETFLVLDSARHADSSKACFVFESSYLHFLQVYFVLQFKPIVCVSLLKHVGMRGLLEINDDRKQYHHFSSLVHISLSLMTSLKIFFTIPDISNWHAVKTLSGPKIFYRINMSKSSLDSRNHWKLHSCDCDSWVCNLEYILCILDRIMLQIYHLDRVWNVIIKMKEIADSWSLNRLCFHCLG